MGVPKFYRWISERYPCLSEVVKEYQVPDFDNLYLDMNGIIHVCSHPNDDDPHFRITEEQIFKDIFHYIEVLFRIIRPRKVFFMAVDGVAPRAKMNQQRGRRFRSAKEAEENIKKALKKGETLPDEKRFDSNCITPGTKFMARLQEQLKHMVQSKVTSDPSWQGIRIYLSGHETPGEGEHKITEFIRYERMQPGYDCNTRHCLYGLDADLMMLGLCSHEPHFSLLREEVRFTGKKKKNARTQKAEETTFHLLHLSLMREYIDHEFETLKSELSFEYNLESIIDDWVLMGFLVGNDFIPNLPNLHIAHNALPMLYATYKKVLPTLDGYLNENGVVNLERFGKYLEVLSKFDSDKFEEQYADFRWLESKVGKSKSKEKSPARSKTSSSVPSANDLDSLSPLEEQRLASEKSAHLADKSLNVVKELSQRQGLLSPDCDVESTDSQDDKQVFEAEFKMFKRNYYQEKLHLEGSSADVARVAYEYVLAIQWICHYYYNGVQSWSWYYPYHYAPYLSDLRNLSKMKLTYSMGEPFLPYQQLLAVLPAASKECLPEPYWDLMCSETSPIVDYYPQEFQCDLNGKQQEWEAVVLIPFISEERLLTAMEPCGKKCRKEEMERNKHSGCLLYTFDSNLDYHAKSSLPGIFPNIVHCKANCEVIPLHSWSTSDTSKFIKGLLPGCRLSVFYPGFPTLYHIPHKCYLKKQSVKVFQMPSKNENMILHIIPPGQKKALTDCEGPAYKKGETLDDIAKNLLGTSIYVNWPHMEEAKAVAVSDGSFKFEVSEQIHADGVKGSKHKMQRKTLSDKERQIYRQDVESIRESYLTRRGVNVERTDFVIYAQPLLGRKYVCGLQGQITLEKQWANQPEAFLLQTAVKDITVRDPTFQKFKGTDELFPIASPIFMLGHPHYGCQGKVLSVNQGMISVELQIPNEPDIRQVIRQKNKLSSVYYPGWELASRIGISSYLLSRITGTIYVFYPPTRKWQLGLNLRFSRENSGVAGYTKVDNREWSYSEAVEVVLREYMEKFPKILLYLQSALKRNEEQFDASEMVRKGKDVIGCLQEVSSWLKNLSCYGGDKVSEFSDMLEARVVDAIVEKVEQVKKMRHPNPVQITLRPNVLYRPLSHQGTLIPDKSAQHRLFDRIVNVRDGYTVPLGMRGTIVGIHRQPGSDILFDVVFDHEFLGGVNFGGRCPKRQGYRVPECAIVNLAHGERAAMKEHKPTAVVRPHNKPASRAKEAPSHVAVKKGHRSSSPRHPNGQEFQRNKQRPQSPLQQRDKPSITLMQRGKSSPKKQTQSQANLFENLWNTLKDQHARMSSAPSTPSASPLKNSEGRSNVARQPSPAKHREDPKAHSQSQAPNSGTSPRKTRKQGLNAQNKVACSYPSLTQAAMSLPKVKTEQIQQKSLNNNSNKPELMVTAASSGTLAATVAEPVKDEAGESSEVAVSPKVATPTSAVTTTSHTTEQKDIDHLNRLLKSLKFTPQQPPHPTPKLAFTPGDPYSMRPINPVHPNYSPIPCPPANPSYPRFHDQAMNFNPSGFFKQSGTRPPYMGRPPTAHIRQGLSPQQMNFMSQWNQNCRPHPATLTHPSAMPTRMSAYSQIAPGHHVPPSFPLDKFLINPGNHSRGLKATEDRLLQEGTQKLCEMLSKENEDAASSQWSTGEDDHDHRDEEEHVENTNTEPEDKITTKPDDLSMKDGTSDADSEKEDYMERSTSVEDDKMSIIQKQTKVDELITLCHQCNMMPPIYTYFTAGEEQVVSTVQLWNGMRFSSRPQLNRDKAMEEAASEAIGYLKNEQKDKRPVSTSPPSSISYFVPVQNVLQPQYYNAPQAAYVPPVTYASGHSPAYLLPSVAPGHVTYPLLPPAPVMSLPPDYQTTHQGMMPAYRFDPSAYNPYLLRMQVSPSHHNNIGPYYHTVGAQPVLWGGPQVALSEAYQIKDFANLQKKATTEYKLVDEPPLPKTPQESECRAETTESKESDAPPDKLDPSLQSQKSKKCAKSAKEGFSAKKQVSSKPKLAISFVKAPDKK